MEEQIEIFYSKQLGKVYLLIIEDDELSTVGNIHDYSKEMGDK